LSSLAKTGLTGFETGLTGLGSDTIQRLVGLKTGLTGFV
jgi:hypothetical protein